MVIYDLDFGFIESKLADSRMLHRELVNKGFTAIGNLLRKYISTEMIATLNAATFGLWSSKCGVGTWEKMAGCTLAWIFNCYFAAGAEGKPHLEYKLHSMIMMTANMKASDPFEISIQLEKIRKLKQELEAEDLTAGQIIEAICKHPVIYHFKHECLQVMQDEAKEKIMTSEELLSRAMKKLASQMAEERVEQGKIDLTISSITQNSATAAVGTGTGGITHIPQEGWDQLSEQERQEHRAKVDSETRIKSTSQATFASNAERFIP